MRLYKFCAAVCVALLLALPAHAAFRPDVRPGKGVTASKMLSDYNPNLKGTDYDTPVYVMEGEKPGGTILIFAGTHPREIGGVLTATVLLENAVVEQGKIFVIPCLNVAGMSVPDELGMVPHRLPMKTRSGSRWVTYGDRRIPLKEGETDPEEFRHPSGYIHPDGQEWRNINRNYPGIADGTPAQMVCWGVMEIIRTEKIGSCLDVHEATAPEEVFDPRDGKTHNGGTLSYAFVTHPKYMETAVEILFELEDLGAPFMLELSNPSFRGISHYEISEHTDCVPFLSETPNPAQNEHAWNKDPLYDEKHPIEERVGLMMDLLRVWFAKCEELTGPIVVSGLPTRQQINDDGVGAWLE